MIWIYIQLKMVKYQNNFIFINKIFPYKTIILKFIINVEFIIILLFTNTYK